MANKIISFGEVWSKKVLVLLGVPIFLCDKNNA